MKSITEIKVRGYHLDFYGHVNNARFLEFMEEARWAMFENRVDLTEWRRQGLAFYVVNINIAYRNSVSLGDILSVRSYITRLGEKSGVLKQEMVNKKTGTMAAEADVTFVIAEAAKKKAIPFTEDMKRLLQVFAEDPEASKKT